VNRRNPWKAATAALLLLGGPAARAVEIHIENNNAPGVGFNDRTPVTPLTLNFGTTRGDQALIDFQTGAAIWGAILRSPVPILIDSAFITAQDDSRFACSASSTVLGYARLTTYDVAPTFPIPQAGYVAALANALAGTDLTPSEAHILARFNADLGTAACAFPAAWYFGLDTQIQGSNVSLLVTLLHEFGHGLGYISFVDPSSGSSSTDPFSSFDYRLFDVDAGTQWTSDTSAERKSLVVTPRSVAFDGTTVRADIPQFLLDVPTLTVSANGGPSTQLVSVPGLFSGPLTGSGAVVVANPLDACADFTNAAQLSGRVALIRRSNPDAGLPCHFWDKANRAEDAGATAVLIFDYTSEPLVEMQGAPQLSIPAVFISQQDGQTLQNEVGQGTVTAGFIPSAEPSNTDPSGTRVLLYTPTTLSLGSTLNHWNSNSYPHTLLMEYSIQDDIRLNLDLTPAVMADMGWSVVQGLSVSVVKALDPNVPAGGEARFLIAIVNRRQTAIDSVSLNLQSPSGTTLVSNQGACTTAFPCALGTLPPGAVLLMVTTLRAAASAADPFTVTATLSPATVFAGDNLTATTTPPVATGGDLQVSVSGPTQLVANATASFKTTVTNAGPGTAAGVSLGGQLVASDGTPLTATNAGACIGNFPCPLGAMVSGASQTINSTFTVPAGFTAGVTFTATATSTTPDPNPANNTATASIAGSGSDGGTGSSSKGGCSATGEPATALAFGALAMALALRRRGNPT
jgi:MYXO-CTERM domain-containing protein